MKEKREEGGWSHDWLGQNLRERDVDSGSSTKNNKVSSKNFKHDLIVIYERLIWQITGAKLNNQEARQGL